MILEILTNIRLHRPTKLRQIMIVKKSETIEDLPYCVPLTPLTRQTTFPTSSLTNNAPVLSKITPTGRPCAFSSALRKPVSTSTGWPAGLPSLKGT